MSQPRKTTIDTYRRYSHKLDLELEDICAACLDTGLNRSQCNVLIELAQNQPMNLAELADNLLVNRSKIRHTIKKMVDSGMVIAEQVDSDHRKKSFRLAANGNRAYRAAMAQANRRFEDALKLLNEQQKNLAIEGLRVFGNALRKSRLQADFSIRLIQKRDNAQVARIIRETLTEFQAVGEGYSIEDAEIDDMYGSYRNARSCFYVITTGKRIVGCGGIAPLTGGEESTCELRKMYFLPTARGLGLGQRLLLLLMDEARKRDFKTCYLETVDRMETANQLYRKNGFRQLKKPRGKTGHCRCDRWYSLDLR